MERTCARCRRALLPRGGHDLVGDDGARVVLCELCAEPARATATAVFVGEGVPAGVGAPWPEPSAGDAASSLSRQAEEAARAAARVARGAASEGAWGRKVEEAEAEAIRCIRAVEAAGDAITQGDPVLDGFPAAARAARAAADALDAAAVALRSAKRRAP